MVTANIPAQTIRATSLADEARAPTSEAEPRRTSCKAGQQVRWKKGARWHLGHLGDPPFEKDGSLRVFEDRNGAARALRPAVVQLLVRGPRGGRVWVPCEPADAASRPAERRSLAGRAGVRSGLPQSEPRAPAQRQARPGPELGL